MTADISPENVARMLEGVTPGPWGAEGPEHSIIIWGYADRDDREYRVCFMTSDGPAQANARFIAWAREAVPALSARLAEVEAERDSWKAETVHWQDTAAATLDRAEAAEADIATLRACAKEEMEKREAAEARAAKLTESLMKIIATANGALDLTATEATLRRDLFCVREELRDLIWPPTAALQGDKT